MQPVNEIKEETTINICGPAGGYAVVQEEGFEEPATVRLNFTGPSGVITTINQPSSSITTSTSYLVGAPFRELISTQLINGTVEQIFKLESPTVLAIWPPRDSKVWYEKETWVPDGNELRLASSIKGKLVPEHYEWEDEIDA